MQRIAHPRPVAPIPTPRPAPSVSDAPKAPTITYRPIGPEVKDQVREAMRRAAAIILSVPAPTPPVQAESEVA